MSERVFMTSAASDKLCQGVYVFIPVGLFVCVSVCLSYEDDHSKSCGRMLVKFLGQLVQVTTRNDHFWLVVG